MTSVKVILCHFCETHGPRVLFCTETTSKNQLNMVSHSRNAGGDLCHACRSVTHPGFVSYTEQGQEDKGQDVTPAGQDVTPAGQPVIYKSSQFPDSDDDFSHVRQACVRSLSNEVCIGREGSIFFGDNKNGYTFCFTFYLRDSKARGLQRFYSLLAWTRDRYFLVNYWSFFEDNFRSIVSQLKQHASKVFESEEKDTVALRFQRGIAPSRSRSLTVLVNLPDVFERLHKQFTWIVRNAFNYYEEVEVPQWLTNFNVEEECISEKCHNEEDAEIEVPPENNEKSIAPELSQLMRFRDVYKLLTRDSFITAGVHTLIGNQVILRGSNRRLVSALVNTFSNLLPVGCCRKIPYSSQYCEAFDANLLGIGQSVNVPQHVMDSDLFVLLDVSCEQLDLSTFKCVVTSNFNVDKSALPKILLDLEKAINSDKILSEPEMMAFYASLKDEWLSNAQTLYQFLKMSGPKTSSSIELCLKTVGAETEVEKMMIRFWLNGLSGKFKKRQLALRKLLSTV